MRHAQHDGHVRVRPAGPPLRLEEGRRVTAHRADVHHAQARGLHLPQLVDGRVPAESAGVDLGVLQRRAAEQHHGPGVPFDVPGGRRVKHQAVERNAQHVRNHHLGRAAGIGVDRARVATEQVEKAVDVALGVVKAPRAGPSVRAAVDGLVAMGFPDMRQRVRRQLQSRVPVHGHEWLHATAGPVAVPGALQVAGPHHGLRDAATRVETVQKRLPDGRGMRVFGIGVDSRHLHTIRFHQVIAPVGAGRDRFTLGLRHATILTEDHAAGTSVRCPPRKCHGFTGDFKRNGSSGAGKSIRPSIRMKRSSPRKGSKRGSRLM